MSSPDRGLLRAAIVALCLLTIAGCGFRPLLAERAGGVATRAELRSIAVDTVDGRFAQEVRNQVIFALSGGAMAEKTHYRLALIVRQTELETAIDPTFDRPTTTILNTTATYRLYRYGEEKPLLTNTAFTSVSFDRSEQRFANVRARRDAEDRAAGVLADDIRARLTVYFAALQPEG